MPRTRLNQRRKRDERNGAVRTWSVIAAIAVLMTACGGDDSPPEPDDELTSAGPSSPAPPDDTTPIAELDVDRLDPSVFDYDSTAEINFEEEPDALDLPVPGTDIHPIVYDSPHGGQVTGYIGYPPEGESDGAILLMHGMPESADEMLVPTAALSCTGAIVLTLDAPFARAERLDRPLVFTEADRDEQIQLIADLRRAVDILESMGVEQIVFDGVSWSGGIGALLAGVEPRIDGYSLMLGGRLVDRFVRDGKPIGPLAAQSDDVVEEWLELMGSVDPSQYVGDATAPILFQNGRQDMIVTPESARALHEAAGQSSEVRWYDDPHEPGPEMVAEHVHWLTDLLGLDADRVDECLAAVGL